MFKKSVVMSNLLFSLLCSGAFSAEPQMVPLGQEPSCAISNPRFQQIEDSSNKETLFQELAPTLAMMKMFLGEDFHDFSGNSEADKEALTQNVRLYFNERKLADHSFMIEQKITYDDELEGKLCQLIQWEQNEYQKGNIVLYHGLRADILYVYRYWGKLFSKLSGQPFELLFRGDALGSIDPQTGVPFKNIQELRSRLGVGTSLRDDYAKEINSRIIHFNPSLSIGKMTSLSTASSVYFWDKGYNATYPDFSNIILGSLILQGMLDKAARAASGEVIQASEKYEKNGAMVAISIPKTDIDRVAMHVKAHGLPYDYRFGEIEAKIDQIFPKSSSVFDPSEDFKSYNSLSEYISKLILTSDVTTADDELMEKIYALHITAAPEDKEFTPEKKEQLKELVNQYICVKLSMNSSVNNLVETLSNAYKSNMPPEKARFLTNEIALYLNPEIMQKASVFYMYRHPMVDDSQELEQLTGRHAEQIRSSKYLNIPEAFPRPVSEAGKYLSIPAISYLIEHAHLFAVQNKLTNEVLADLVKPEAGMKRYSMAILKSVGEFFRHEFTDESGYLLGLTEQLLKNESLFEKNTENNSVVLKLQCGNQELFDRLLETTLKQKQKLSNSDSDMLFSHFVGYCHWICGYRCDLTPFPGMVADLSSKWNASEDLIRKAFTDDGKGQKFWSYELDNVLKLTHPKAVEQDKASSNP